MENDNTITNTIPLEDWKFECASCSMKFKTQKDFKQHFKFVQCNKRKTCPTCGKIIVSKFGMKIHIDRVHRGIKNHQCEICNKRFSDSSDMKKHVKYTHGKCKFQCEMCAKTFGHSSSLKKHIKSTHEGLKAYKCSECPKSYNNSGTLFKHKKTVHEGIKFQCDICFKSFTQPRNLQNHKKVLHSKNSHENIKCQECLQIFANIYSMKTHTQTVHLGIKLFECKHCGKAFTNPRNMNIHINSFHKSENERDIFECKYCKKLYRSSVNLRKHVNDYHEKPKKHTCEICGKACLPSNLKAHQKRMHEKHSNDQKCDICSKVLDGKSKLINHKKMSHSHLIKRIHCDLCDVSYTSSSYMKLHVEKVHRESQKFPCEYCGKTFPVAKYLKTHVISMHLTEIQ